jgi:Fe-S-cluster containining protein
MNRIVSKKLQIGIDMADHPCLPSDRTQLDERPFHFHCHPQVSCFLVCCYNVDLLLYPFDVILLKNSLGIHSEDFLQKHVIVCAGSHSYFPGIQLKMTEDTSRACPFLAENGCRVYRSRPSACRTYPLERGVERLPGTQKLRAHYFLTHHPYCKGHQESRTYTVEQWEREQMLHECNAYNDRWAELDAFFATNPWAGEGHAGPYQQLAFMVCYNIDGFRGYTEQHRLLNAFKLSKNERRRIQNDDGALLLFGFDWLETILGGQTRLSRK